MPRKIDLGDASDAESSVAKPKGPPRPKETVRAENFVSLYANNAEVDLTPWDVRLRFGEVTQANREKLLISDVAQVYLSPQHAKALLRALEGGIAIYEKQYGEIPDPIKYLEASKTNAP